MAFTPDQLRVAGNVLAVARKFRAAFYCPVPDLVHLAVTLQESGWNDQAEDTQDPQGSFGPYQINQLAHPNTAQLAQSPWADYAFYICMGPWLVAWRQVGGGWSQESQRGAVLEAFAPLAQGSVPWSPGLGQTRYNEALAALEELS